MFEFVLHEIETQYVSNQIDYFPNCLMKITYINTIISRMEVLYDK